MSMQMVPIEKIKEAKENPRKTFDAAGMKELTESIRTQGVITPLSLRQVNGIFYVAAGNRRLRAAKALGLKELPATVKEMTDDEFLEVLTVENLQRENVHPLEEADAYAQMVNGGKSPAQVATRVSKSEAYVRGRLGLTNLLAAAQVLFRKGEIPVTHAILLSQLDKETQKRAIGDPKNGRISGLFTVDQAGYGLGLDEEKKLKVVSLPELRMWIDKDTRFNRGKVDSFLFPDTAQELAKAKEKALSVVPITLMHSVPPNAKADERTYTVRSWKFADGKELPPEVFPKKGQKSRTCDKSVLGVFVVGPKRGETAKVCVDKGCAIHKPKAKPKTDPEKANAEQAQQRQEEKWAKQRAAAKLYADLWKSVKKEIAKAFEAGVDKDKLVKGSPVWSLFDPQGKIKGNTTEDLVRTLAWDRLDRMLDYVDANKHKDMVKLARKFGFDLDKVLAKAPEPKPEPEEKPKKNGKKAEPQVEEPEELEDEENEEEDEE